MRGGNISHSQWEESPQSQMDTKVENPDFVDTFIADDKGRVNFGTDYANKKMKVAAGVLEDENNEDD